MNTLTIVHDFLRRQVKPGAFCIDATAGKGRDTALLCHLAGEQGRVLAAWDGQVLAGWLRYGWFWDNIPFLNLLFVQKEYRGQGWGKRLLRRWEEEMKQQGFSVLLTSTQAREQSQHFYRHLGYRDVGGFLLPPEPYELILAKTI